MSYYTDTVARGLDDYYSGRGESPGVWIGAGARSVGLHGDVPEEDLGILFSGRLPGSGESLGAEYTVRDGVDRVTGWDLTFSAPKSVSALWALGGGEVGMHVREAHDAAVAAALEYLEEHAAFARTGKAGIRQVDTDGFLGAAFVHRTSRAGDPQLHTHVLVSGRVRCSNDGVWRALDSRALHRQLKPAGMLYQAALRAELTDRHGIEWGEISRHGQAEIEGVPRDILELFSKRTRMVERRARELIAAAEAEQRRGLSAKGRRRIYEVAVLETRPAKDLGGGPVEGLFDRWRTETETAGVGDGWVGGVLGHRRLAVSADRDTVVAEILEELARTRSTWTRVDVVREAARRVPVVIGNAAAARAWVEAVSDWVIAQPTVVTLTAADPVAAGLCRRDGRSVYERHDAARYSTVATLAIEQRVLDIATAGQGADRGLADRDAVEHAIDVHRLGVDQAEAVRAVTLDGDSVACVVGPAGTGKSRMLAAAVDAWADTDVPVRGLAVSAVAAGVLAGETGLPAETIAKFLREQSRPGGPDPAYRLEPGEVLVVDEASMVASADLARLVVLADQAGGKVVLVGDWAQLGAVDAGGLFALLARDGAAELHEVRRFANDWERDASLRLRDRDPTVVAVYAAHGRITGGDHDTVLDTAFQAWVEARDRGDSIVLCAGDRATVDALARRCQAARIAAGDVTPTELVAGEHTIGVGDEIVTTRNQRRLTTDRGCWVRNGDRWQVLAIDGDGSIVVDNLSGRGRLRLPADYVAEEVTLAYAVTTHKAQGLTVDHAIVIVDDHTTAEALYVGMTRGRHTNTALAVTDDLDPEHHTLDQSADATDALARALRRVGVEPAAIDVLQRAVRDGESLATLRPRLANLDAAIALDRPPDRSGELELLTARRDHLTEHARPGVLTRAGRDARNQLDILDHRIRHLTAEQQRLHAWSDANVDVLAYRDRLADAAAHRERALAINAALREPPHIVELLGPVPEDDADYRRWLTHAGRIEAYREEWNVDPDQIHEPPIDGIQRRAWEATSLRVLDDFRRIEPEPSRTLEPGIGLEL